VSTPYLIIEVDDDETYIVDTTRTRNSIGSTSGSDPLMEDGKKPSSTNMSGVTPNRSRSGSDSTRREWDRTHGTSIISQ
jgi:hypothetical protein